MFPSDLEFVAEPQMIVYEEQELETCDLCGADSDDCSLLDNGTLVCPRCIREAMGQQRLELPHA